MITNITLFFIKTFHNLKLDVYIEKNNNKILESSQSLLRKRNVKMKKIKNKKRERERDERNKVGAYVRQNFAT